MVHMNAIPSVSHSPGVFIACIWNHENMYVRRIVGYRGNACSRCVFANSTCTCIYQNYVVFLKGIASPGKCNRL